MSLPPWFLGEIPTELLRLARANCEEPVHRQILADWVERYGGEEGRSLCRFFRRDPIVRHDASTWQTLSASEARLVEPFSDLVLGIGDRVVLPLTETQGITMGWVPAGNSWLGGGKKGGQSFYPKKAFGLSRLKNVYGVVFTRLLRSSGRLLWAIILVIFMADLITRWNRFRTKMCTSFCTR